MHLQPREFVGRVSWLPRPLVGSAAIDANGGLESALLKHTPTDALEIWIARGTSELLMPKEREIISAVVQGERTPRLTTFLDNVLKPPAGLPILTTNYDRLIEVACEMAGFHVETKAVGPYAGAFDHARSVPLFCHVVWLPD